MMRTPAVLFARVLARVSARVSVRVLACVLARVLACLVLAGCWSTELAKQHWTAEPPDRPDAIQGPIDTPPRPQRLRSPPRSSRSRRTRCARWS